MANKIKCVRCGDIIFSPLHCFLFAHNLPSRDLRAKAARFDFCLSCSVDFVDFLRRPAEQADEEGVWAK